MGFVKRHATGFTIILFLLGVLALSALPLPSWLRPLTAFEHEEPWGELTQSIVRPSKSGPRKSDVASADWVTHGQAGAGGGEDEDAPRPELEVGHRAADSRDAGAAPEGARTRSPWERPSRPKLDEYQERLGLEALPIEMPCVSAPAKAPAGDPPKAGEGACGRRALDRFFARLDDAADERAGAIVRVAHFGDSIIASDHITDMVRLRLQERFGSAGKGFLLITRYNDRQRRLRAGDGKSWRAEHIALGDLTDFGFGYAGAAFTSESAGAETVFRDLGASLSAEIYYLAQPGSGEVEVFADDELVEVLDTNGAPRRAAIEKLALPEGTKALRLRAKSAGIRLFGVSFEAGVPGVIYESIGVPGATSEVWQYPEAEGFKAQLEHRDPALVVTQLGGNDVRTIHQKRRTIEDVERTTRGFIQRLKDAVPGADCLILTPLDSVHAKTGGEMVSKPEIGQVIEVQKRIARAEGCALWDLHASMGGAGALERWYRAELINPDLIHPRALGGDLLGELMAEALMNAYDARLVPKAEASPAVP